MAKTFSGMINYGIGENGSPVTTFKILAINGNDQRKVYFKAEINSLCKSLRVAKNADKVRRTSVKSGN